VSQGAPKVCHTLSPICQKILIRLYSLTCQNVAIDLSLAALTLVVQLTRSLLDDRLDQTSLILFTTHQMSILSEGPLLKL
jgi:hypothetical protein